MDKYKIILIGPACSGKSTFIMQLKNEEENIFPDIQKYEPTIGVDFYAKVLNHNSRDIKIHIWDTAGQDRFDSIVNSYYKDIDMVILLYDINDNDNYSKINKWCQKIIDLSGNKPTVLLGNKIDIQDKQFEEKDNNINESNIIKHFQISVFDLDNVKYVMDYIYTYIINNIPRNKNDSISLKELPTKKNSCCF